MKDFDELEFEYKEVEAPQVDKYAHQKRSLLLNVTRSDAVRSALENWLMSFEGGLSRSAFMTQVEKLSFEDEQALKQIEKSMGRRTIAKQKTVLPPLPEVGDVLRMLADKTLFIAVSGREEPLHAFIRNTYQTLKKLGKAYVLDLNDVKLEWVEKYKKGKSVDMLQRAKEADFLIMVGFETPLDLPFYIGDTLNTLRRYRVEHELPIISTFARFREKEKFFEYFQKFCVKTVDNG